MYMNGSIKKKSSNIIITEVLFIFIICSVVKDTEFMFLKTEQTIIAENVICKLFCILLIAVVLRHHKMKWKNLGFRKNGLIKGVACGFILGSVTFFISWTVEFIVLLAIGKHPGLSFFITNFALSEQNINKLSVTAVLICILGNIFNVWAEEGLFRGLFLNLLLKRLSFRKANFLQALLFGFWHIITVILWMKDGMLTLPTALVMSVGYIVLAGVLGYEWGLCISLTGTVWTGIFEHFFNNFIGNVLHTVTKTGIDELQIFRIVLSNFLSLSLVLIWSKKKKTAASISY